MKGKVRVEDVVCRGAINRRDMRRVLMDPTVGDLTFARPNRRNWGKGKNGSGI